MGAVKFQRIFVPAPVPNNRKSRQECYIYKCKRCKKTMSYEETDQHALDHKGTSIVINIS